VNGCLGTSTSPVPTNHRRELARSSRGAGWDGPRGTIERRVSQRDFLTRDWPSRNATNGLRIRSPISAAEASLDSGARRPCTTYAADPVARLAFSERGAAFSGSSTTHQRVDNRHRGSVTYTMLARRTAVCEANSDGCPRLAPTLPVGANGPWTSTGSHIVTCPRTQRWRTRIHRGRVLHNRGVVGARWHAIWIQPAVHDDLVARGVQVLLPGPCVRFFFFSGPSR